MKICEKLKKKNINKMERLLCITMSNLLNYLNLFSFLE